MIKMKTIDQIMFKEHKRIEETLNQLENQEDLLKIKKIFSKLTWQIEKHIFVEEKVIFRLYNNEEDIINIDILIKEHRDIFFLIEKIEYAIIQGNRPDISELKRIINAHAKFEDEVLYPKLDEELSEEEKELIIERSKELIIE